MKSHAHHDVPIRTCNLLTQKGKKKSSGSSEHESLFRVPRSPAYLGRFIPEATVSQSRGRCSPREGGREGGEGAGRGINLMTVELRVQPQFTSHVPQP